MARHTLAAGSPALSPAAAPWRTSWETSPRRSVPERRLPSVINDHGVVPGPDVGNTDHRAVAPDPTGERPQDPAPPNRPGQPTPSDRPSRAARVRGAAAWADGPARAGPTGRPGVDGPGVDGPGVDGPGVDGPGVNGSARVGGSARASLLGSGRGPANLDRCSARHHGRRAWGPDGPYCRPCSCVGSPCGQGFRSRTQPQAGLAVTGGCGRRSPVTVVDSWAGLAVTGGCGRRSPATVVDSRAGLAVTGGCRRRSPATVADSRAGLAVTGGRRRRSPATVADSRAGLAVTGGRRRRSPATMGDSHARPAVKRISDGPLSYTTPADATVARARERPDRPTVRTRSCAGPPPSRCSPRVTPSPPRPRLRLRLRLRRHRTRHPRRDVDLLALRNRCDQEAKTAISHRQQINTTTRTHPASSSTTQPTQRQPTPRRRAHPAPHPPVLPAQPDKSATRCQTNHSATPV